MQDIQMNQEFMQKITELLDKVSHDCRLICDLDDLEEEIEGNEELEEEYNEWLEERLDQIKKQANLLRFFFQFASYINKNNSDT